MPHGLIARKIGMTQLYDETGTVVPVTVLQAGPCVVVDSRSDERDGYQSVQLGLVEARPPKRVTKPLDGHFKKAGVPPVRVLREFRLDAGESLQPGDKVLVNATFKAGDKVDVVGVSKGKGFQGVMKRHNFRGGAASHGSMFHRAPGSVGASSYPSRTFPGTRMGGHMGAERVTMKNLTVVRIDDARNLLMVKGAVPGSNGGYLTILKAGVSVASIAVRDLRNQSVGDFQLDDAVFAERPKTHAVYEEVKRYLASLRSGTHATKTRAMVSGAGRKLWKQKGTGRARVGSIRSPLWRHGGTTHGPQPHPHDLDIPRKVKKLAMRVVLSAKVKKNSLVVLDKIEFEDARTKHAAEIFRGLDLASGVLVVEEAGNDKLRRATRNLPGVKVVAPSALSVYDVLRHTSLVLTRSTAAKVTELFRP